MVVIDSVLVIGADDLPGLLPLPETFVVDHSNIIRKRYAGPLTPQVWQNEFEPLITQIEAEFLASSTSKGSQ